jgi:rhomboid protease GluP
MKQYYSNFHENEMFFAVKELKDGIYCVIISDIKNEDKDYSEAIKYIKSLGKPFSLNMILLADEGYIYTDKSPMAHKLIINKYNYKVIECDKYCMPLKQILNDVIQENEAKVIQTKEKFLENKVITFILIGVNIIIFLITALLSRNIFNINQNILIGFGAKSNMLIEQGQAWRLLTCAFLHSGLIHIGFNMYSLYIIGPQIEQVFGKSKYLIIYIISCITSSLLSYLMSPYSISVGASGGIFGLMGALLAFAISERHKIQKKYLSSLIQIIVINLFIGLSIKNIDNFGHIGGLVGGFLIGHISYRMSRKET